MDSALNYPAREWVLLSLLPGMTPHRWRSVLAHCDSPLEILRLSPASLKALRILPATRKAIADWQAGTPDPVVMERLLEAVTHIRRTQISLLTWDDPDYPPQLRHIHDPPPLLYLRGRRQVLEKPQIAIVGSRHASRDGLAHAHRFAAALADAGYSVVSGLALGADTAAHKGALDKAGATVAVLAAGVERIYPRSNALLEPCLLQQGALVSEMPPGTPNRPENFPRRNRIISGLSQGVLVVEAGARSGSLITARLALEQGREVFAIPGSIHNPLARGCHQLLREGARLVETLDDILQELGDWHSVQKPRAPAEPAMPVRTPDLSGLGQDEQALFQALGYEPASTDALCERSGLPPDRLLQSLLLLEMEALVEASAGGYRKCAG